MRLRPARMGFHEAHSTRVSILHARCATANFMLALQETGVCKGLEWQAVMWVI